MSETTGTPGPAYPRGPQSPQEGPGRHAEPLSREQANQAAAEQLRGQAAQPPADHAGGTVAAVQSDPQRDVFLPMEERINKMMADFETRSQRQDQEMAALRAQLGAAQASLGTPAVEKYATAVVDRLHTASTTSGLPQSHWDELRKLVGGLTEVTDAAVKSGDGSKVADEIAKVEKWITRKHPRMTNVVVEHFPAVLSDLEYLGEEALKLAA